MEGDLGGFTEDIQKFKDTWREGDLGGVMEDIQRSKDTWREGDLGGGGYPEI